MRSIRWEGDDVNILGFEGNSPDRLLRGGKNRYLHILHTADERLGMELV